MGLLRGRTTGRRPPCASTVRPFPSLSLPTSPPHFPFFPLSSSPFLLSFSFFLRSSFFFLLPSPPSPPPLRHDRRPHPRPDVRLVHDLVTIPLLGQKQLPVVCEIHLPSVPRHERVKRRRRLARLRPEDAAEPLRLFLSASERPRDLDHHVGVGQVDGEVPDLRQHELAQLAAAELAVKLLALGVRRLPGNQG